ncbi:hypothetical protein ABO162_002436 [Salmonella enterica subsp. enterica serovar Chester]
MKTPVELLSSVADREVNIAQVSGARASMVGNHMKSSVPIDHPEPSPHFTGADTNYHDFLFNDIVEDSGSICHYTTKEGRQRRATFTRYGRRGDSRALEHAIFFRRAECRIPGKTMIDVIEINFYTNHDNVFSSEKWESPKLRSLLRGETDQLEKDEILTTMPCMVDGEFADSVVLPTVTISHPDIIEDSYTISEEAAQKLHGYGLKVIEKTLREDEFLLDTYGYNDPEGNRVPRYFPDVGEAIRDDGLVIASRRFDDLYAAIDATLGETQHVSPFFDSCDYVDADPIHYKARLENNHELMERSGTRIVDIQVWRDETSCGNGTNNINCTEENKRELDKYALALKDYYNAIVRFYFSVSRDKNIIWSPKACVLLEKAFASETYEVYAEFREEIRGVIEDAIRRGEYGKENVSQQIISKLTSPVQRGLSDPINTYTIRIAVRYPIPVTVSSKITDRSGTKGIVGRVLPVEQMPINEFGERVHVLRSMNAVIRRSTYAALFHMYWSAASEQLKMRLKPMLDEGRIGECWEILMDYLSRYNPEWANTLQATHPTEDLQRELFKEIYDFTIRIYLPHELDDTPVEISERLGEFKPRKSKLLITNYDGKQEWTKDEFYVGGVETLRLDKTGREFSSISSMYLNYLGTIDASNQGRGSYPVNYKTLKWAGPSEERLLAGYGPGNYEEVHDRANNPAVHREILVGLYRSQTPSNPGVLVDRNKLPLGDSQIDRMMKNIHSCEGFELVKMKRGEE